MDIQKNLQELKEIYDKKLISPEIYAEQQRALLSDHMSTKADVEPDIKTNKQPTPRQAEKPGRPFWIQLLMAAFVIIGVVVIIYQFSDRKGKDAINQLATIGGVAKVIPWSDRADTAARGILAANEALFPKNILALTHPTGKNPTLTRSSVSKLDDRILVKMTIGWVDGFFAKNHETTVVWEITEAGHASAIITSDDAIVQANQHDKERLNNDFRTNAYPAFYKALTGNP